MKATATRPAEGICRHRNAEKLYDCDRPVGKPGWTWCSEHVKAHAEAKRAAAKKAAPRASKPKAAAKRPPRGKVVPLKADEAPLDPMERELAAVKDMKERTASAK
jgi:hypothetical protein